MILLCSFGACGESFSKTKTGLWYKTIHKGTGLKPQEGEIMLLNMCYKTEKGKVIFDTSEQALPAVLKYEEARYPKDGGPKEAISMLQQGDKMAFKFSAKKLFEENFEQAAEQYELKEKDLIILHLELTDIMTEEKFKEWEKEKLAAILKEKLAQAEQQLEKDIQIIEQYVAEKALDVQKTDSGLYYAIEAPGKGTKPQAGQKVKVNYTGYLLSGKVFDTSLEDIAKEHNIHNPQRPYEPIAFQLGIGQVIKGWDEGIQLLSKGAKAKFLIPSTLAYGTRAMGSSIPAKSILIFDVELVDVE